MAKHVEIARMLQEVMTINAEVKTDMQKCNAEMKADTRKCDTKLKAGFKNDIQAGNKII